MAQINLLPWREQARKQKIIKFAVLSIASIGAGFIMVLFLHLYFKSLTNTQQERNDFLLNAINDESTELTQLNKQKKEATQVIADLNFIFSLRKESSQAIKLLDVLPSTVPEAVKIVSLTREGNKISITGRANSNLQITAFMDNLRKTTIFAQPDLANISGKENSTGEERFFQLVVNQKSPTD